jgi:hypothetical protein
MNPHSDYVDPDAHGPSSAACLRQYDSKAAFEAMYPCQPRNCRPTRAVLNVTIDPRARESCSVLAAMTFSAPVQLVSI